MDRRHQPECLSIHPRKKIYIEKRYSIPKYGISIRQSICSFLLQINQPALSRLYTNLFICFPFTGRLKIRNCRCNDPYRFGR